MKTIFLLIWFMDSSFTIQAYETEKVCEEARALAAKKYPKAEWIKCAKNQLRKEVDVDLKEGKRA